MSGETERDVSGWTVDTLHVHIDTQFRDLVRHLDERFESQQAMVKTALDASDKRFESVNEFRAMVNDQQRQFVLRAEYATAHKSLEDKVDALQSRVENQAGVTKQTYRFIGFGFAALAIIVTFVSFLANYLTR